MSKRLGFFCEQEINWGSGVYFVSKRMGAIVRCPATLFRYMWFIVFPTWQFLYLLCADLNCICIGCISYIPCVQHRDRISRVLCFKYFSSIPFHFPLSSYFSGNQQYLVPLFCALANFGCFRFLLHLKYVMLHLNMFAFFTRSVSMGQLTSEFKVLLWQLSYLSQTYACSVIVSLTHRAIII